MTTTIVYLLHCDHAGCDRAAPKDDSEGWTDAIYTHGCPDHSEGITAHKANVTSNTRGRGSREKTYWYLKCACGWTPQPYFAIFSAKGLKDQHVRHVADVTAV